MNSRFKFPRRVRIHGGECGAVARALHHKVKGLSLYQADSGKALGSTFNERKQMSTKTTLKRIALVAVSALGFGVLTSVAPASATVTPTAITVGTIPGGAQVGTAHTTPVSISAPFTTGGSDTFSISVKVTSSPAGSAFRAPATNGLVLGGGAGVSFAAGVYARSGDT